LTILGSREIWLNLTGTGRSQGTVVIPSLGEPIRTEIESEKTDAN
jgi:hypothetical protein